MSTSASIYDPKKLLKKFGLKSFRLGQREIIDSILKKQDTMAIMPTGGGKSLCYQLPAVSRSGITIVISPLIALMNDQVKALTDLQIPVGCLHSGQSIAEKKKIFQDMQKEEHYILYISPERVQKEGFAPWIKKQNINFIAIDESHCVSQWGHDFRPEYAQLSKIREWCPDIPIIALTATATPLVTSDIINNLKLQKPERHVYGFYRPNLYYQVEFCQDDYDKENFLLQAIKQTPRGRIIIYCGTRKKTEEWTQFISSNSHLLQNKEHNGENNTVGYYHAGLSTKDRQQIELDYKEGRTRILAATNAFGMGIDHPDVRLVVHTQMPGNIESYYQEIGRAGRDKEDSSCLLLYSKRDKGLHSFFIQSSDAEQNIKNHRWQALDAIVQYAEGGECRHADILTYFKDKKRISNCGHCDSCAPKSERKIKPVSFVEILKNKSATKIAKLKKKKSSALSMASMDIEAQTRMNTLRQWRKKYAASKDIPAFIVFSDKTLMDLALKAPKSLDDLYQVYGLGEKKIHTFGNEILKNIT